MQIRALHRRRLVLGGAAAMLLAGRAGAQARSNGPLVLVVPFAPGGVVDKTAREVHAGLGRRLGQTVVIENHDGAGGTIGTSIVARSKADGHTIGLVYDSYATEPLAYPNLPYRAGRDLTGVSYMVRAPMALVVPAASPWRTLQDYVRACRQSREVSYASVGVGSSNHLTAEWFHRAAGTHGLHVPFRGGAPALKDLLGGHVDSMFASLPLVLAQLQAGKLRALAVSSSARNPHLPTVPTLADTWPGLVTYSWVGMIARAGTPAAQLDRLAAAVSQALREPAVTQRLYDNGFEVVASGREAMNALVASEAARWAELARQRTLALG
ncbi:MAG: tripartite tricarboxylate transporter substrate-binding protein [Cupriavidus necator]